MSQSFPMTSEGAEMLKKELEQLKSKTRPAIINAIAEAREHGDLKENAEYHAAREQQGFVEARINEIEFKLSQAQVIDISTIPNNGRVIFGAYIELEDCETGKSEHYRIVGEDQADIKAGLLSNNSPIARALIGKEEGEIVEIKVPGGTRNLEIVEVNYKKPD